MGISALIGANPGVRAQKRRWPVTPVLCVILMSLLIFGLSTNAQASIAYVQGANVNPTSNNGTLSATFSQAAQVEGDFNVVIVAWADTSVSVTSISDSKGNAYTLAGTVTNTPAGSKQSIYYATNIVAAAVSTNTVTIQFSGSWLAWPELKMAEYGGIVTSSPLDGITGQVSSTGTAMSSGSLTTTNANDLLVGSDYADANTIGHDSNFTQRFQTAGTEIFEDRIVSATGSYSAGATGDSSGPWLMQIAAFKAASTGGDTTAPTAPSGLTATVNSSSQITLIWTASTDNVGITGYRVERCSGASCTTFAQIGTPTATSYTDAALTASTSYSYRVRATDAAGNLSAYSSTASGTTTATGDTTAPSAPTGLAATANTSSQITLTWTASTDNVGVTGYKVERCQGVSCSTFAQIGTPTATAYTDTGLAASTSYSYRVRATDAAGNLSLYSTTSSATTLSTADTTAPSAPGTPSLSVVSSSQINLTWTASTDNVGVTGYKVERCQGASCSTFAQTAAPATTSYSDTGLAASTSYSYRIRATDAAGNLSAYSAISSAVTSSAGTIAYIQGTSQNPSTNPGTLTATFASAQIAGDLIVAIVAWGDPSVSLTSLSDTKGNTYTLAATLTNASANTQQRFYYASNVVASAAGANTVTAHLSGSLNWPEIKVAEYSGIATTNPLDAITGQVSASGTAISSGSLTTTNANDLLVASDLANDTTPASDPAYTQRYQTSGGEIYEDRVVTSAGSYSAGATQASSGAWLMQLAAFKAAAAGGDTTAPTAPSGLTATVNSSTQITLSWTASTDNVGVTGYKVERCQGTSCSTFAQVGTTTAAVSYVDNGLTASTSYSYRVRATDAAGNLSSYSSTASAQASTSADTTSPTAPTGLSASAASSSAINLSWTASTDNVGVTGYRVERCQGAGCSTFTQIGTPTTSSYSDSSLSGSTSYSYRVRAADAATNLSSYSSIVSASTLAAGDTTPPTTPGAPSLTVVSASQINVSWSAASDNVAVTGYLVERCQGTSCSSFAQVAAPTGTSLSDTSLTGSTSYSYRLRAVDGAGNLSGYSGVASASTGSGTNAYHYDSAGRLISVDTSSGTRYYHYDAAGNLTSVTATP